MMDMGWPMDPTVGLAFSEIAARQQEDAVVVTWRFSADEPVAGFDIQRRNEAGGDVRLANGDGLLPATARSFTDRDVRAGAAYRYQVAAVRPDGSEALSPYVVVATRGYALALDQNHPNPFNAATEMRYRLEHDTRVALRIYDISGRLVRTLIDAPRAAGGVHGPAHVHHEVGGELASGSYFYMLETDAETRIRRMVLLK